jgi:ADP-dependent NAD(P)H-hydrate dehydratase
MSKSDEVRLPDRPADGHKGTFGRVMIVGGSRGMSGAAALAGLGALRGGAGLVYVAVPEGIESIVASTEPSYLVVPQWEDEVGRLSAKALPGLSEHAQSMDAVAIGPGWGQSDDLQKVAGHLYAHVECPMVVDADALNLLARDSSLIERHSGPRVLTPHPGEFARLTGTDIKSVQSDRRRRAEAFARAHEVVVVLKGRESVITDGATT